MSNDLLKKLQNTLKISDNIIEKEGYKQDVSYSFLVDGDTYLLLEKNNVKKSLSIYYKDKPIGRLEESRLDSMNSLNFQTSNYEEDLKVFNVISNHNFDFSGLESIVKNKKIENFVEIENIKEFYDYLKIEVGEIQNTFFDYNTKDELKNIKGFIDNDLSYSIRREFHNTDYKIVLQVVIFNDVPKTYIEISNNTDEDDLILEINGITIQEETVLSMIGYQLLVLDTENWTDIFRMIEKEISSLIKEVKG